MNIKSLAVAALAGALLIGNSSLWADNPDVYPSMPNTQAVASPALTPSELDSLVAPIALYPDTLVSQILVASTYPLEIVQAAQWLDQNSTLKGTDLTKAAQDQSWDASIQALVIFPDVIKRLSQDVTWTTNLGNAFLARQGDVMDAVQRLRAKAEDSGKLTSTPQEKVTTTTDQGQKVIEIEPANPGTVYVPYYDPTLIWGEPDYFAYPAWYYPPRPYGAYFWFGSGISLSFCYGPAWRPSWGWGWHPGWHDRTVIVNNNFMHHYNYHSAVVAGHDGAAVWHHDAAHRLGVAYPNRAVARQYHPAFYAAHPRPNVAQAQAQFHAATQRSTFHATEIQHFGHRDIPAAPYGRTHNAFSGVNEGARAHAYSHRGYSSLSHATAHAAVGGAHAGGNAGGHGGAHMGADHGGGGHSSGHGK